MNVENINKEAANMINSMRERGFSNLESILILNTSLVIINVWTVKNGIESLNNEEKHTNN